jgi:hypothetical protein
VTLRDMFRDDDGRSFEERRDEVVALLIEATDLRGREHHLRRDVHRCGRASTESEFNRAYENLVAAISDTPLCA